jgi:FkbH-like protein
MPMLSESERQAIRQKLTAAIGDKKTSDVVRLARELVQSGKTSDTLYCASAFSSLAVELVAHNGYKRLKTFVVRSVTIEPILPFLKVEAALAGYILDFEVGGYGSYMDEMLNPQSELNASRAALVLVLLDIEEVSGRLPDLCADGRGVGVEQEISESVSRVGQMLRSYRERSTGRLVVQGCVAPYMTSMGPVGEGLLKYGLVNAVKQLNRQLLELCGSISDCIFFDVDEVAARYGRIAWRDQRLFLSSRLPISTAAFAVYTAALVRTICPLFRAPRKVLCTDLDNTLWGGVLGEDGPQGIVTGSAFPGNCYLEYQKYLAHLAARGILLAIVSKNNDADVREAFVLRSADMAVRLDQFVATKIGWNEKAESIRELATELSLGLDSFVFVDDSPVECAAMRQYVPEVAVVELPGDKPWEFVRMLAEEWFFDSLAVTDDDINRQKEYEAQAQRQALLTSANSKEEFLQSLEIVCTFIDAVDAPLARSVQLLAKTNQFNLTTRRRTSAEVERFAGVQGGQAIAVRVRDRFGDAGVVGLALASQEGDRCVIDSLLLSCRVIGRGIETALLACIAGRAAHMGIRWLIGEYVESKKNAPCKSFYPQHGFERESSSSGVTSEFYRLDLRERIPGKPSWLTVEGDTPYELAADTTDTL